MCCRPTSLQKCTQWNTHAHEQHLQYVCCCLLLQDEGREEMEKVGESQALLLMSVISSLLSLYSILF